MSTVNICQQLERFYGTCHSVKLLFYSISSLQNAYEGAQRMEGGFDNW